MIVDRQTRRLALIRLFRDIGGAQPEPLGEEALEREWRQTGLRASDLPLVLQEMVDDGLLERERHGGIVEYRLSFDGATLCVRTWQPSLLASTLRAWRRWRTRPAHERRARAATPGAAGVRGDRRAR
ncbi:hypothetical protein [Solimonas flava]|uniref:hypothetical protein n=1 Tax=Solimonas flava TaxID=415849 RepID=UPI0003F74339|nr:hypothetical protein [Solimonas flava]